MNGSNLNKPFVEENLSLFDDLYSLVIKGICNKVNLDFENSILFENNFGSLNSVNNFFLKKEIEKKNEENKEYIQLKTKRPKEKNNEKNEIGNSPTSNKSSNLFKNKIIKNVQKRDVIRKAFETQYISHIKERLGKIIPKQKKKFFTHVLKKIINPTNESNKKDIIVLSLKEIIEKFISENEKNKKEEEKVKYFKKLLFESKEHEIFNLSLYNLIKGYYDDLYENKDLLTTLKTKDGEKFKKMNDNFKKIGKVNFPIIDFEYNGGERHYGYLKYYFDDKREHSKKSSALIFTHKIEK